MMKNNKKNKKITQKNNRGITLIALVITIIVLLILAGISITMLSGDNGVLTKVTESREETRGGAVQEQRDLWKLEQTSDQYAKTQSAKSLATLLQELGPNGQKLLTVDEINTINETGQVTIGRKRIVFKEILTVGSEYDKGNIKIGDKLSYSANGASDWIVFGKDDAGNVLLTTQSTVGSYQVTTTREKWFTYENDLDSACSVYAGTIQGKEIKSRSIRMDDINRVVGFTAPEGKIYKFGITQDFNNGKVSYYYPNEKNSSFVKATVDDISISENSTEIPAAELLSNTYYYWQPNADLKVVDQETGEDISSKFTNLNNMIYVTGDKNSWMQYWIATKTIFVKSYAVECRVSRVNYSYVRISR